jgi:hypothetical protein
MMARALSPPTKLCGRRQPVLFNPSRVSTLPRPVDPRGEACRLEREFVLIAAIVAIICLGLGLAAYLAYLTKGFKVDNPLSNERSSSARIGDE